MFRLKEVLRTQYTAAVLIAGLLWIPADAAGQQASAADTWTPPRTLDGQPDLQGYYAHVGMGTGDDEKPVTLCPPDPSGQARGCYERLWHEAELDHIRPTAIRLRTGVIDPPDGRVPLQPWAAAFKKAYKDNQADPRTLMHVDTHARCLQSGVPRTNWAVSHAGYQFLQFPGFVVIYTEYNQQNRIIPLDGRPHVGPGIRLFGGDSVGYWEGATLVVDTTNVAVPPATGLGMLDLQGTPFTDAIHIVERFTLADPDTIAYEATIEDSKAFTRPWTTAGGFVRQPNDYQIFEYACHEGNYSFENLAFAIPRRQRR